MIIIGQADQSTRIIYNNESLRALAEEHFDDPNLWTTILKFNNLNSAADLKPGMELQIPAALVKKTREKLTNTKNVINIATKNGAKIFTPDLLDSSITFLDLATSQAGNEEWDLAYISIDRANRLALKSLETSQLLRNQSADATVSYRMGDVQSRKPSQRIWEEALQYKKLFEKDRARTLSDSYAEITFIDLNRVRLNENSQALIQESRIDVLKSKTDSKVKLTKGDAFAYLAKSPKRNFDIDLSGIETKISSKHFWIGQEEKSTKIANYDGEIKFKAEDSIVVLKENQGSIIPTDGLPSKPRELLSSPSLLSPANQSRNYSNEILFAWEEVAGAEKYWFEIADQPSFHTVVYSNKNLNTEKIIVGSLLPGLYYWHVSSIDENGFPGKFNEYYIMDVLVDNSKPFLHIESPENQLATKSASIEVSGETEPDVSLFLNDTSLELFGEGKFKTQVTLQDGLNKLSFKSVDMAGNETCNEREVIYESNPDVTLTINNENYSASKKTITFNSDLIKIDGITRALSSIDLQLVKSGKKLKAFADKSGCYNFIFTLDAGSETAVQTILTAAGYTRTDTIILQVDKNIPEIQLVKSIPKFTSQNALILEGNVAGGNELRINGQKIDLFDGHFSHEYFLTNGKNNLEFESFGNSGLSSGLSANVYYDSAPPDLLEHSLTNSPADKNLYTIRIKAQDESELKKSSKIELDINGELKNLILVLNNEKSFYEKNVSIPGVQLSDIKIKSILLEDYLGNEKIYNIN